MALTVRDVLAEPDLGIGLVSGEPDALTRPSAGWPSPSWPTRGRS
ncbi:hypothetical protein [Fodinicola feengrottensis]|nr:hypothetical protein [Fodinicola feengrottensis]